MLIYNLGSVLFKNVYIRNLPAKFHIMQDFDSSYIANSVFNAFFSYTAIMLNSVTIHAIRKTPSLPKTSKTLLLSLAVSDLGAGLLAQPFYIAFLAMKLEEYTAINSAYLALFRIIRYLFFFASFFGIVALSADRFLAIHLHLRYQELVTHKRVVAVAISSWVFSAFLSFITQWVPTPIRSKIFAVVEFTCFIIIGLLYYKIYGTVRRHQHQIQALQVQQTEQNGGMTGNASNFARLKKSAVGTFYIYLVFMICYLPGCCTLVIHIIDGSSYILKSISFYMTTLVYLNSSLNPLIYCWKMRHIRHAVMNIVRNVLTKHN